MLFCVSAASNSKGTAPRPHGHVVLAGRIHEVLVFAADAVAAVLVPNLVTFPSFPFPFPASAYGDDMGASTGPGSSGRTFYDNTEVLYTIDQCVTGWDARRAEWLRLHHPRRLNASDGMRRRERVLMVSGS